MVVVTTAAFADVPNQPQSITPEVSSTPHVSPVPAQPQPQPQPEPHPVNAHDSGKDSPHTPSATDDLEMLLLVAAAAASGILGARLLPRWRVAPRQTPDGRFEDAEMTAFEPRPWNESGRREPATGPAPSVEPALVPPVHERPVVVSVPDAARPSVATEPNVTIAPAPPSEVIPTPSHDVPPVVVMPPRGPSTVDALRETRASHSHQSWGSFNRDALPRLLFYGRSKFCQFSADKLHAADQWFVIGDIHGDFFALHTIVSYIRKACPQFGIIFLGDLIDRGPHPIECLWYLLKVADDHPERVLWLAGNHDVGARYDEDTGVFRSTVEPAEFVADLNIVDSFAPLRRAFGREYIELADGLPRAALMPDGLLLTHGGFPHTDLQAEVANMTLNSDRRKWLESEPVVRDFTHLRITKYPLRRPNRLSISCSYGYQDFDSFKQAMAGYGIKRLVTGHQHAAMGFEDHPEWAKHGHEALTLTGFGFADAYDRPESYATNYRRTLVFGRCRPDQIPEVIQIPVDEHDLQSFFDSEIKAMRRFAVS